MSLLLKRLCREKGTAIILITHDMGVSAETADRVAVMYAGRIVEIGPLRDVVKAAYHPYTRGLMGSIPTLESGRERLAQIPGSMPRLTDIPAGCAFNPRCGEVMAHCRLVRPELAPVGRAVVACHLMTAESGGAQVPGHALLPTLVPSPKAARCPGSPSKIWRACSTCRGRGSIESSSASRSAC